MDYEEHQSKPADISIEDEADVDKTMSEVAECLKLDRGETLIFESIYDFRRKVDAHHYHSQTMFPKPPQALTQMFQGYASLPNKINQGHHQRRCRLTQSLV
jgi:hypothetical protein